jgi:AmiR/NasT family two-component response regulator
MAVLHEDRALALEQRITAVRWSLQGNIRRLEESLSSLRAIRQQIQAGRLERELLHESAYARLEARLESLPVIEQAKGILMAQTGCDAEQAFDMLRRASQRSNVQVRDLAGQIVMRAASAGSAAPGERR